MSGYKPEGCQIMSYLQEKKHCWGRDAKMFRTSAINNTAYLKCSVIYQVGYMVTFPFVLSTSGGYKHQQGNLQPTHRHKNI